MMRKNIALCAIAAIAIGSAALSTPVLARGGGGGGHGGGFGGGHGGGFGGHIGGGFGGHFGGGGIGHFGGGMAHFGGIGHVAGRPIGHVGVVGHRVTGSRLGEIHAFGDRHVGRDRLGHRRVRLGRGFWGGDYGYDTCYSPWSAEWNPYCSYY